MKYINFLFLFFISGAFLLFHACSDKDSNEDVPCQSNLMVDLGNDTTLDAGNSLTLDAGNPGSTYIWSTGDISQTIIVNESGTYWVTVTDPCQVSMTDSIEVIFCSIPVVDLGEDKQISPGESLTLDAGNPGAAYVWSTGETTQTIIVEETGIYWVNVTLCNVTVSDTIRVDILYPTIKISTDFGDFRIWLYQETPLHRANFLDLTNQQFYDGLIFHRVVENFVIQGGDPLGTGYGGPGYTIPAEIIPGLNHVYGAVGAARQPDNVNPDKESNGSQFYVVCDPNGEPGLNGNYTVFGIVFDGLNTVHDISVVPVDENDRPLNDVVMNTVIIENFTAKALKDQFDFIIP